MATVYYYGLLGTRNSATVTLSSVTFNSLITTISTAEGLSSGYYAASLETNPRINSVTSGTTTFSVLGIADNSTIICTPLQTGTKEADLLAAKYVGNTATNISNTLTNHRPWN